MVWNCKNTGLGYVGLIQQCLFHSLKWDTEEAEEGNCLQPWLSDLASEHYTSFDSTERGLTIGILSTGKIVLAVS